MTLSHVLGGLLGLAVIVIGVQKCNLDAIAREREGLAYSKDSVEAVLDTTRNITTGALGKLLGDSLQAFQRRIVQAEQVEDAIDRALAKQGVAHRKALAEIAVTIEDLVTTIASSGPTEEDAEGVRRATFNVAETPYRGTVGVMLPTPPLPGTIDLRLAVDPINLDVRIGCGATNADGIRPATINAIAPPWADVKFPTVTADRSVCADPVRRRWFDNFFAGPGFGLLVKPNGDAHAGATFSAGYDLLPLLRRPRR